MTQALRFVTEANQANNDMLSKGEPTYPANQLQYVADDYGMVDRYLNDDTIGATFNDGSKVLWDAPAQLWRVDTQQTLPLMEDINTVRSQRRRCQRDLNAKVEELFHSKATVLLMQAKLDDYKAKFQPLNDRIADLTWENKEAVDCVSEYREENNDLNVDWSNDRNDLVKSQDRVKELNAKLEVTFSNRKVQEIHLERTITGLNRDNFDLSKANDALGIEVSGLKTKLADSLSAGQVKDEMAERIEQLEAAATASPTKGVLESFEAIDGVERAFICRKAEGFISIGLAVADLPMSMADGRSFKEQVGVTHRAVCPSGVTMIIEYFRGE